jgi:hypothetical protein
MVLSVRACSAALLSLILPPASGVSAVQCLFCLTIVRGGAEAAVVTGRPPSEDILVYGKRMVVCLGCWCPGPMTDMLWCMYANMEESILN